MKSFQGEALEQATIERDGLAGDRAWALRDAASGRLLSARRHPSLLLASGSISAGGDPVVTMPDRTRLVGTGPNTDGALSEWLRRPVRLVAATAEPSREGEYYGDEAPARFVDAFPLLVLTTASLRTAAAGHPAGDWDVRRFRPNLLIDVDGGRDGGDGWIEEGWIGHRVSVGGVVLVPRRRCERCPMVVRPQPGLERDSAVLKSLVQGHGGTLGVWSAVAATGMVRVGDAVTIS